MAATVQRNTILPEIDTSGLHFSADEIGWCALGPTIAVTVLATVFVALRWYARAVVARCVGKDDVIILISLLLTWTMCILAGLEYDLGFGSYDSTEVDTQRLTKLIIVSNDIWCLATNVTKALIVAQYLRIFTSPVLRYACALILTLLLLSACWGIIAGTFLCQPTEKLWTPELPGHCMDSLSYWISVAGINSALDLTVLVLPLPFIMTLHLPHRQKVCTSTLFLLGFLVVIVSVVSFTTVYTEAARGDRIKSGMYAILWSAVEVNIGIVCASLLALKPLIALWFPALLEDQPAPRLHGWRRIWSRSRIVDLRDEGMAEQLPQALNRLQSTAQREDSGMQAIRSKSNSSSIEPAILKLAGVKIRDFGSESSSHESRPDSH